MGRVNPDVIHLDSFRRYPIRLQLRRAGFHPSHRVGQSGPVFLGRGLTRDHHGPRVVCLFVSLCYVSLDSRHLLGSLGEDGLGDPRGADGRRNTGEVSHLLSSVLM